MSEFNKNNKKILPIQIPPPIISYLPAANISSIAAANLRDNSWVINNFVQLFIQSGEKKLETFPNQDFMYYDQNLFHIDVMSDNNTCFKRENIHQQIKNWIIHNNYVVVYVDEFEVPETRLYKKIHKLHSQLIYGFDDGEKKYNVLNYSVSGIEIRALKVDYRYIENAIFSKSTNQLFLEDQISWNTRGTMHKIILIRFMGNKGAHFYHGINNDYIIHEIDNFVYSKNSSNDSYFFTGKLTGTWGIDTYNEIIKMIQVEKFLDLRVFSLLLEHKIYMKQRLELFENGQTFSELYIKIINQAETLKFLCIKHNMLEGVLDYIEKQDKISNISVIKKQMIAIIAELKTKEKYILINFLAEQG